LSEANIYLYHLFDQDVSESSPSRPYDKITGDPACSWWFGWFGVIPICSAPANTLSTSTRPTCFVFLPALRPPALPILTFLRVSRFTLLLYTMLRTWLIYPYTIILTLQTSSPPQLQQHRFQLLNGQASCKLPRRRHLLLQHRRQSQKQASPFLYIPKRPFRIIFLPTWMISR